MNIQDGHELPLLPLHALGVCLSRCQTRHQPWHLHTPSPIRG